jgi:hypothetical protein
MFWKKISIFQYQKIEKKEKEKRVITSNIDFNSPTKSSFWVVKVEECHQSRMSSQIIQIEKYPKGFPIFLMQNIKSH